MRWEISKKNIDIPPENLDINPVVYSILKTRGLSDDEIIEFIKPDIEKLENPFRFKDMEKSVDKIIKKIKEKEKIMIFGDYDVDGTTGTALIYKVLKKIGGDVIYYIPHRINEGYGFSKNGVEFARENNVALIITVDCGIKAVESVNLAKKYGIDVIITDHHETGEEIPEAFAIIDPKYDENYPFKFLSGVGVAFKLCQGIISEIKDLYKFLMWQLDLVALGTIADVVPLLGENRILTKYGLIVLNRLKKPGIKLLKEVANLKRDIRSEDVAFILGPRMNAMGRIAHANETVKLLITNNFEEARNIALKMDYLNRERQTSEKDIIDEAEKFIKEIDLDRYWSFVLWSEKWHEGIIGIAASKIVERYSRPTILFSLNEELAKGSGRSIKDVNLLEALNGCKDLFIQFGGHSGAAGILLHKDNLIEFRERFNDTVKTFMMPEMLEGSIDIEMELEMDDIKDSLYNALKELEPYGEGNPSPVFLLRSVKIIGYPENYNGDNVRFFITKNSIQQKVISFNNKKLLQKIKGKHNVDIVFNISKSREGNIYLKLLDYKICG